MAQFFSAADHMLAFLSACTFLVVCCETGDTREFINIDCGKPRNYHGKDKITGLTYTSDFEYIDAGEVHKVSSRHQGSSPYGHSDDLRSFPSGKRNCYTLKPLDAGGRYLVRAFFLYGNYDGLDRPPKFDVHLGVNIWDTVEITNSSLYYHSEIFAFASSSTLSFCLINTDSGTPFVSAIDVRPSDEDVLGVLEVNASQSLMTTHRLDFGATHTTPLRYKIDEVDRLWSPFNKPEWKKMSTTSRITGTHVYHLPQEVMATAATTLIRRRLDFSLPFRKTVPQRRYHLVFHFAELQPPSQMQNQSRIMSIYVNGDRWHYNFTIDDFNQVNSWYNGDPESHDELDFSIRSEDDSTLPPFINALQVYLIRPLPVRPTQATDDIKEYYMLRKNWMGDPCSPKDFIWDGLQCIYDNKDDPHIVSLDLSSSGLTGQVASSFEKLVELESLDLSNNNLIGEVPSFLGNLRHLRYLNLAGNKLNYSIPKNLKNKERVGMLEILIEEETETNPAKDSNKLIIILGVSISFGGVVLIAALVVIMILRRKASTHREYGSHTSNVPSQNSASSELFPSLRLGNKFTYQEILMITKNFRRQIGEGGFSKVYHGSLCNGEEVAVKMLLESSSQAYKQFKTEANLLMRVHHKYVVPLLGYCNENGQLALVYRYMEHGSLADHLSGGTTQSLHLSWKERLRISLEAAKGLAYLHDECKPTIIHRDVKTSNILLDANLVVGIGDFGFSRTFQDDASTTELVGTPGYLDPECHYTNKQTEKGDVYSFGIVLLELVIGKAPIVFKKIEGITLVEKAQNFFEMDTLSDVVDKRLEGIYNPNSIQGVVEIAMRCTSLNSKNRPSMIEVLSYLNSCFLSECGVTSTTDETFP